MGRPPKPFADPVSISRDRGHLRIRYYPTGIITSPNDRIYLPGKWRADDPAEIAAVHRVADELRQELAAHRAAHGITTALPSGIRVNIGASINAFLEALEHDKAPHGTVNTRRSQLRVCLGPYLKRDIDQLVSVAPAVVQQARSSTTSRGKASDNTIAGRLSALARYGEWVAEAYRTVNPFANCVSTDEDRRARKRLAREAAMANAQRETPLDDEEDDHALLRGDFPGSAVPIALSRAIFLKETGRLPGSDASSPRIVRLGRPIGDEHASQIAQAPMFAANTGLRQCEVLAVHTSRINLEELVINVDRQVDRYKPWTGSTPPLVPPKGFRQRYAVVFPSYAETLDRLRWFADRNTGGWLFAPTRGQARWVDGFIDMCERAGDFLEAERQIAVDGGVGHDQLPVTWQHTFHGFRHLYASLALTPQSAGGLGWSVSFVQASMGHRSERTLREYYQHITKEEHRAAIAVPFVWPSAS